MREISMQVLRGISLAADGADAVGSSPGDFSAHVKAEVVKYAKLVKQVGLKSE